MRRVGQAELAALVGVSVRQLSRLERGDCRPTRDTAERLAAALGSSADYLFPAIHEKKGPGPSHPDPLGSRVTGYVEG